jgi:hypothetical protein
MAWRAAALEWCYGVGGGEASEPFPIRAFEH